MINYYRQACRVALGCCVLLVSTSAYSEEWQWSVTPYGWLISTDLETSISIPPDGNNPGVSANFGSLLSKLDFAAQLHFEGQRGDYGFLLDVTNLQLSDRKTKGPFKVDTDSSTTLIEGAMLFGAPEDGLQFLLGVRALNVKFDLEIEGAGPVGVVLKASADATLADAMVGARYNFALSDKWNLIVRGDIATGDTDFSWNTSIVLGRALGKSGAVELGYRYMAIKFEDEDELVEPELAMNGPMIGYTFRF